jgi:hypothetical protein
MTPEEIFSEVTSVYDQYVEVLETGEVQALQDYATPPSPTTSCRPWRPHD